MSSFKDKNTGTKEKTETKLTPREQFDKDVKDADLDLTDCPVHINEKPTAKTGTGVGMFKDVDKYIVYTIDENGRYQGRESISNIEEAYALLKYWVARRLCDRYGFGHSFPIEVAFMSADDFLDSYQHMLGIDKLHINYEMDSMRDFDMLMNYRYLKQNPRLLIEAKYFVYCHDFVPAPRATNISGFTAENVHARLRDSFGGEFVSYLDSFDIMATLSNHPELADKLDDLIKQMYDITYHFEKHNEDDYYDVLDKLNKVTAKRDN